MKRTLAHLERAALVGSALVLPLVFLELVNRRGYGEDFPCPMFGLLWLLPVAFTLVLTRLLGQVGHRSIQLVLGGVLLLLIAGLWIGIVLDQMPCFLGVRFCD
ncbi:MAG: hypothetical protein N2383_13830 [Caldilineales bacterium]|nr:hypothetical protein [Caldilineales bacterium]